MLQIKEIVNSIFTSKTYILYKEGVEKAWLVDIGDVEPVLDFLEEKRMFVEGVLLNMLILIIFMVWCRWWKDSQNVRFI